MRGIATEPGCLACHGSHLAPDVQAALAARYCVAFVLVNQGEDRGTIGGFLDGQGLAFEHMLLGPHSRTMLETGTRGLPTTLFFDARRRLVDTHMGELTRASLADTLRRRFGESAPPRGPPIHSTLRRVDSRQGAATGERPYSCRSGAAWPRPAPAPILQEVVDMSTIQGRPARRPTPPPIARIALACALVLAAAGAQANDAWLTSGDIRFGYVSSETRARSGATSDADSFRARARFRVRGDLGGGWHASGRVAARLDTEQSNDEFWMRTYAPGPGGLEDGQATIDEAYLEYRPDESPWSLRLGRFQAAFGVDDIMKKSLDQNDSSNFDITWTDGIWWQWRGQDWTTHVIARHNDRRGPTGSLRRPLDFADGGSRASLFMAVESKTAIGPVVQRMVTVSWLPSALRTNGLADPALEDYLAVTAKGAAEWPLGQGATKFRLGGELGWAPETPRREAMNSGTGDADALSWQTSFSLMDVLPDHDVGIVYGRVADGWLLSSDFRPNDELLEVRWVWQASAAWQLDARLRRREEIDLPAASARARRDDDLYVRATWRF